MVDFRGLLERRSVNAAVAWLSTGVLGLAIVALLDAGIWLWAAFAIVAVGVVVLPPVLTRSPTTTLPGELVALVTVPVVLRASGVLLQVTPFATMAGLALLLALVLDAFTSLEMAPRFAVLFVVVITMAFAGIWAIGEFAADLFLGTEFVVGQRELNVDLVTATAVGLVAGVAFEAYFRETDGDAPLDSPPLVLPLGIRSAPDPSGSGSERPDEVAVSTAAVESGRETEASQEAELADEPADEPTEADDGVEESPRYRLAIRALQFVLISIVVYAIATMQGALFVNSAVPLLLTLLPAIARWRYGYPMQAGLALLIAFAATLHAVGSLGPYQTTDWYDTVTHALSSTLVAGVGYTIARSVELHTDRVSFSSRFRGAFIVLFVLAVGVLWEILEFGSGLAAGVVGKSVLAQYGVDDIVKDLTFNVVGALVVAVWGRPLFRRPARVLTDSVGDRLQ